MRVLLFSTILGFSFGPTPVLAMDENDIGKCNRYYTSKTGFKEIPITEVTCLFPKGRRQLIKGFVPGDGDCSLHTLKVLFPHKDINRQTFFDTLFHAYRTGNPDLQENIRTELLNEVFMELFNPLLDRAQRPRGSSPALVELATQMEAQVGDIIRTFVKPNWQRDGLSREEEVLCQFTRYRAAETPIGLNYGELRNIHTRIYAQIGWEINPENCPTPYNQQALEGLAEVIWGQVNHPLHEDTVDKYLTLVRNRLREDDDLFLQILPYMASNDIFLTSVGDEAQGHDGRGTLDLACRLFKLNVVLFSNSHKVRSIYHYGEPSTPDKFMILAGGHYSPLAAQDDYETQQEMVNKFVALMRLRQGVFKTFAPFTDLDREFPTSSEGVARHMRWPVFDPASGLWQDYRHPESVAHPAAISAFSSAPPSASYATSSRDRGGSSGYGASSYFGTEDLPSEPSYPPVEDTTERVKVVMLSLQLEIDAGHSPTIILRDALQLNKTDPIYRQAVSNMLPMLTRPFEQDVKREIEAMLRSFPLPYATPDWSDVTKPSDISLSHLKTSRGLIDIDECVTLFVHARGSLPAKAAAIQLQERIQEILIYAPEEERRLLNAALPRAIEELKRETLPIIREVITEPHSSSHSQRQETERRELEDLLSKQNYPAAFQKTKREVRCSDEEIVKFLLESNGYLKWNTLTPEIKQWVIRNLQGSL
ncbi:MAG: hypothetical protein JSR85_08125 [Proteobacteria bacterium]|nr:hypothetical protein [Pseudomonadota bacterium]